MRWRRSRRCAAAVSADAWSSAAGELCYRSQPVFTPFVGDDLDIDALAGLIDGWLAEAGLTRRSLPAAEPSSPGWQPTLRRPRRCGGWCIERISAGLVATTQDPHLRVVAGLWQLRAALCQADPARLFLNLDIGGGTSNLALGRGDTVLLTDVLQVGARHLRFVPGSYRLIAASPVGAAAGQQESKTPSGAGLSRLGSRPCVAASWRSLEERVVFYTDQPGRREYRGLLGWRRRADLSTSHCHQASGRPSSPVSADATTLAGSGRRSGPGGELAAHILASPILARDVHSTRPQMLGRATVCGLALHNVEVSGSTLYLPIPALLPLADLPVVATLPYTATDAELAAAFALPTAAAGPASPCGMPTASAVALGQRLRPFLPAAMPRQSSSSSTETAAKRWAITPRTGARDPVGSSSWTRSASPAAQFVTLGRRRHTVVPLSFYGRSRPDRSPFPVGSIHVPAPRPDALYACSVAGSGIASVDSSDCSAPPTTARRAIATWAGRPIGSRGAKRCGLLSDLTLQHLFDHPLTDDRGGIDEVMRELRHRSRDLLLARRPALGRAQRPPARRQSKPGRDARPRTTGVMAAALGCCSMCNELILRRGEDPSSDPCAHPAGPARHAVIPPAAQPSQRRSTRHPDAALPRPVDGRRRCPARHQSSRRYRAERHRAPHPARQDARAHRRPDPDLRAVACKTQLACLGRGVPIDILFQSLAGTEQTNLTEFDISVALIDEAYARWPQSGALSGTASSSLYFETGQGSEFTYGKHHGIDMTTTEALCYGLARRWDPFMVNNVTGFIGPETHRDNHEMIVSNLRDHFMGKLLGLPMGMAPCYTLHAHINLEGQQMATGLLTTAGANYYMDVHLNTDRMLAYFDTSGHDDRPCASSMERRPRPSIAWAIARGIPGR